MALLDALRVLTEFEPPAELPPCDLAELADVLEAHGLAALVSYQIETHQLGAALPMALRERLLTLYQGTVNDNVFRILALRRLLKATASVPVVLQGGAAYADWLYPHLAFRPLQPLRLYVRGEDGERFFEEAAEVGFRRVEIRAGGHEASLTDGRLELFLREGLVAGSDLGLFERSRPYSALGPNAARPAPEDALLSTVVELADLGLYAPLTTYIDLRQLLRLEPTLESETIQVRAAAAGLQRALYGSLQLVSHFFPSVSERARALLPRLGPAEKLAVDAVVEAGRDPAKLRRWLGSETAARVVVAPRPSHRNRLREPKVE